MNNYEVREMLKNYLERNEIDPLHIEYVMATVDALINEVRAKERMDTLNEIQEGILTESIYTAILESDENTEYKM